MMDASDTGGGVCLTTGADAELRAEGRWAARGGWATCPGELPVLEEWLRALPREGPEPIEISAPAGVRPRLRR
eukprot:3403231-Alexandrium_andersonii.AAC.1